MRIKRNRVTDEARSKLSWVLSFWFAVALGCIFAASGNLFSFGDGSVLPLSTFLLPLVYIPLQVCCDIFGKNWALEIVKHGTVASIAVFLAYMVTGVVSDHAPVPVIAALPFVFFGATPFLVVIATSWARKKFSDKLETRYLVGSAPFAVSASILLAVTYGPSAVFLSLMGGIMPLVVAAFITSWVASWAAEKTKISLKASQT